MERNIQSADRYLPIVEDLEQRGYSVRDDALPEDLWRSLAAQAKARWQAGMFFAARIGKSRQRNVNIRSDWICWLDEQRVHPAERAYLSWIEGLRFAVNRAFFLGAFSFEAHYARYGPGAFYARHRDCLRGDDRRALTVICYLNEHWHEAEGGALRLFTPQGAKEIWPIGGRVVVFFSDRIEHEVRMAHRERWSLTGWLCRRALHALA